MSLLVPGGEFGDYTVVRLLGTGGMGEAWLLRSPSGLEVAAKIMDAESSGNREARRRFLREARLALDMKHPHLVETYDIGEDPETGLCYILMEYMPGGTLADWIKVHGAMPIKDAMAVLQAIASVLELGRAKGIVHRDIKPANIMFAADGTPKLADLGIAYADSRDSELTTMTQTGMMMGTPAYMAPEQMLDSHHVDTRADIYSLGVVFFEMLTGERPNKDDTIIQLMAKAVKGEPLPDVRTLRPEVSASLAMLLQMMVAPDRESRPSTPGQIAVAIDSIRRTGKFKTSARRDKASRKPFPWKIPLLACAIAGIAAAAFFGIARKKPAAPPPAVKVAESAAGTAVLETAKPNRVEKAEVVTNAIDLNPMRTVNGQRTADGGFAEWDKALAMAKKTGKRLFTPSTGISTNDEGRLGGGSGGGPALGPYIDRVRQALSKGGEQISGDKAKTLLSKGYAKLAAKIDTPPVSSKMKAKAIEDMRDESATKAVQKTLNALFPGWKTSENKEDDKREGYVMEHLGRKDCVCTHPPSPDRPNVILRNRLTVSGTNPVLRFSVAAKSPFCEFRVRAKVNGTLVFEEDISGGKWRDVCIDLSRWRQNHSVNVELVHRATGWNYEFAYWWRMEVAEWDGTEQRIRKFTPAEQILDRSRFADSNPTKAVKKAFRTLFPGWNVSLNGGTENIGFYEEFKHRHNLVMTHPPSQDVPVVLSRQVKVPKSGGTLHLEVASHDSGDFELEVYVRGKIELCATIKPEQDFAEIDVDLSKHAGRSVKIEIRHVPNNWQNEMAFWSKIELR